MAQSDTFIIRQQSATIAALQEQIRLQAEREKQWEKIVVDLNDHLEVAHKYIEDLKLHIGIQKKTEADLFEELAHAIPLDVYHKKLEPKVN